MSNAVTEERTPMTPQEREAAFAEIRAIHQEFEEDRKAEGGMPSARSFLALSLPLALGAAAVFWGLRSDLSSGGRTLAGAIGLTLLTAAAAFLAGFSAARWWRHRRA